MYISEIDWKMKNEKRNFYKIAKKNIILKFKFFNKNFEKVKMIFKSTRLALEIRI